MRTVAGTCLTLFGGGLMLLGSFLPGTAPGSETLNFGLLVDKIVLAVNGSALFIAGAVALTSKRN